MQIIPFTSPTAKEQALAVLKSGGLVICPTETVYGALVDATNQQAVNKLLAYKKRPAGKALSIACANQKMADQYVKINDQAAKIYGALLPGPVTVVSQDLKKTATGLASEFGTLGVRIPDYPFLLDLLTTFGQPLTATSANSSGQKTPYSISDILNHLSAKQKSLIDLIIDAGALPKNPPSLVIDTTLSTPMILRKNSTISQKITDQSSIFTTHSDQETRDLAGKILLQNFARLHQTGLILALDGALGAGKTTFTQGLANFLQIPEPITSPTYTYLKQYDWKKFDQSGKLYHFDVWTIDQPEMLTLLEIDQIQQPHCLLVIEWYNNIAGFFSPQIPLIHLTIEPDPQNPDFRQIAVNSEK